MEDITIRPLEPRDASQATRVWCAGLQQTVDTAPDDEIRQKYAEYFAKSVENECAPGGAMGINGEGLINYYCGSCSGGGDTGRGGDEQQRGSDATMFVAVQQQQQSDDTVKQKEKVIGMVGVKRGMDCKTFPTDQTTEDYGIFSIWKMSVEAESRGKGVGKQLMAAAEEWVRRQQDAKTMRLYTANPIAASFYTNKDVGFINVKKTDYYGIYEKKLM